ncbi:MAG: hypothetical protein CMJ25_09490 [Phycisphaerae bacterium]|nr:hypothetical protein [Phycisphaerae bacterium]
MANTIIPAELLESSGNNIKIGSTAGDSITDGTKNIAIGTDAGTAITTATENVAVGYAALTAATTGGNNIAIGKDALIALTTGNTNVAIGTDALTTNVAGDRNVAIGEQALQNMNPSGNVDTLNVAVGYNAMLATTTGVANTAVGALALDANTTASYNTAVGYNSLSANTTGTQNTALGTDAGKNITTGSYNITIGYKAGAHDVDITTGQQNTVIGAYADTGASDAIQVNIIGYNVTGAEGYTTVGVGTDDIRAAHGTASWGTVSDERVKKDIEDATVGLAFINDLRPVTFNYKNKGDLPENFRGYEEGSTEVYKNSKTQHGFIAQEVKAAIDKHNDIKDGFSMWDDDDPTSQQRVGETAVIPVLVKAVQELSAEIEELKNTKCKCQ